MTDIVIRPTGDRLAGAIAGNRAALMPDSGAFDKNRRSRLNQFIEWLDAAGGHWHRPDLTAYRDYLLDRDEETYRDARGYTRTRRALSPAAAQAHLSTIRGRYAVLLKDNSARDMLYDLAAQRTDDITERKAFVDEMVTRIRNAVDPIHSKVKVPTKQDQADSEHLRLTIDQANALVAAPGLGTVKALRDTAIIALALCTGAREAELAALEIPDLRQTLGGELALHIREGKGAKERLVPYGALDWCLAIVDKWLELAGIDAGRVFRSVDRHGNIGDSITPLAIQHVLKSYPISIGGQRRMVKPHDLRRTYARRQYEAGLDLVSLQQNLGHASTETTLNYIGKLDADKRRAKAVFSFDLSALDDVPMPQRMEI
jgi:site-specific recombinase XerD